MVNIQYHEATPELEIQATTQRDPRAGEFTTPESSTIRTVLMIGVVLTAAYFIFK